MSTADEITMTMLMAQARMEAYRANLQIKLALDMWRNIQYCAIFSDINLRTVHAMQIVDSILWPKHYSHPGKFPELHCIRFV